MMLRKLAVVCALAALVPAAASAQSRVSTALGPRMGFSSNPDQLVLGGQMDLGQVAPDLTFTPNLELGFGDNATVVAINGDLHYHFQVQGSDWRPYVGGGLGVNFIEVDLPAPFANVSNTEIGANLIVGAIVPTRSGSRFFTELRLGVGDIPDMKLLMGWNFKM